MGNHKNEYSSLKISFAGYDDDQQQIHSMIKGGKIKEQLSLDVEIFRIYIPKNSENDTRLPFVTDFEEIVYGFFDVLIIGKVYSCVNDKIFSLARQSLATGKDIIVVDPEFIDAYCKQICKIAENYHLSVKSSFCIEDTIMGLAEIASYRSNKNMELV